MHNKIHDNQGVILIALLWILTALAIIALSFSRETFVELAAARNTRDLSDAYFIARAGITDAAYQLVKKRFQPAVRQVELNDAPEPIDLGKVAGTFADGAYDVDIQDESGKISLNYVSEEQLRRLLEVLEIPQTDLDIIADSVLDWRDVDTLHRINGAEDDYYQTLNPPYQAKNGRIDAVEELLLVRGLTSDYFYGHSEKNPDGSVILRYGLSRYLTAYGLSNRINVNFAPLPVLNSVPGMTPEAANAIFERRKTKPFSNMAEVNKELPSNLSATTIPFLTTEQTFIYTLTASGYRENSKVRRLIRAVIALDPQESLRYRVIYWNENVPNL
ncbi:MAG: gspK2 [Acidobacteria bacterium]|nr:gspK2 [Acidobacteriota bacterium]